MFTRSLLALGVVAATAGVVAAQRLDTVVETPIAGSYPQEAFARKDRFYARVDAAALPANNKAGAGIYRYDWPQRRWFRVGDAADQIVVDINGKLYARSARWGVTAYSGDGTQWSTIGGPSKSLVVAGTRLFSVAPNGDIYGYSGQGDRWAKVGGPASYFAGTDAGTLFGGGPNGLWQYSGNGEQWANVTPNPNAGLVGGGDRVFSKSAGTDGFVWSYAPANREWKQWTDRAAHGWYPFASGDNLIAHVVHDRFDLQAEYPLCFGYTGPATARVVAGVGRVIGSGSDCLLCSVYRNDRQHIGFIKR